MIAESGAKGIEKAKKEIPDTIILDLMMPEMDGFEVCNKLKAIPTTKNIPMVVLTAYKTDLQERIRALELGADVFLTLPIDNHELIAMV